MTFRPWVFVTMAASLTLACTEDIDIPPVGPTIDTFVSPTTETEQLVRGGKPAGTGLIINGDDSLVPVDDATTWEAAITLENGYNIVQVYTRSAAGLRSLEAAYATIMVTSFPASPSAPDVPSPTNVTSQTFTGIKPAGTALLLNDAEVVPLDDETTYSFEVELDEGDGPYAFSLVAVNEQGNRSEPTDFVIVLDTAPPGVAYTVPADDDTAAFQNSAIVVAFDELVDLPIDMLPPGLASVTLDATPISVVANYHTFSGALELRHGMTLAEGSVVEVTLDLTEVSDLAGNPASTTDVVFAFTVGPDVLDQPPAAPSVDAVPSPTFDEFASLSGSREALTAVYLNNAQIVALGADTNWSYSHLLNLGENNLALSTRNLADQDSPNSTDLSIVRELERPDPPVVLTEIPPETNDATLELVGEKPADTALLVDGNLVVPRGPDTDWTYSLSLIPGPNTITLETRNAIGNLSDPVLISIQKIQAYEDGPVEPGFVLKIDVPLRDLSTVDPIRGSFVTGPNQFAVDVWLEGPLEPGETCVFNPDTKQRENIKFFSTIQHYIGSTDGHTNPFLDEDYRNGDYVAALVTGGIFTDIGPGVVRRDPVTGQQGGSLTDASGNSVLDSDRLAMIDGVTRQTIRSPITESISWLPLKNFQRIDQGEYLLWVTLNMDRDPGWVNNNDTETCWADAAYTSLGPHRFVTKVLLGPEPFTRVLAPNTEQAGPDAEAGADQLRYVADPGITVRWVQE